MRRRWREFKTIAIALFDETAWPIAGSLAAIVIWKILYWAN